MINQTINYTLITFVVENVAIDADERNDEKKTMTTISPLVDLLVGKMQSDCGKEISN